MSKVLGSVYGDKVGNAPLMLLVLQSSKGYGNRLASGGPCASMYSHIKKVKGSFLILDTDVCVETNVELFQTKTIELIVM